MRVAWRAIEQSVVFEFFFLGGVGETGVFVFFLGWGKTVRWGVFVFFWRKQ